MDRFGVVPLYGGTRVTVLEHSTVPTLVGSLGQRNLRQIDMDVVHIRLPDGSEAWVSASFVIES